jgi:hypothetical protein
MAVDRNRDGEVRAGGRGEFRIFHGSGEIPGKGGQFGEAAHGLGGGDLVQDRRRLREIVQQGERERRSLLFAACTDRGEQVSCMRGRPGSILVVVVSCPGLEELDNVVAAEITVSVGQEVPPEVGVGADGITASSASTSCR